jgi:hypothetical protein
LPARPAYSRGPARPKAPLPPPTQLRDASGS